MRRVKFNLDMKPELMEILACPLCKGPLELSVKEEKDGEIITGSLYCARCAETYPIEDAIPNLLPPDMRREMGRKERRS